MKRTSALRVVWLAIVSPLMEKNPLKLGAATAVPIVLSMSRLIVLAFATGMLRQIWSAGIAGWPEATLAIAIVLALPILNALDRSDPPHVIDLANALIGRFGLGDARKVASVYGIEPSKYDDHRNDAPGARVSISPECR